MLNDMNNITAQIFHGLMSRQNIFGNGESKMNINGEWVQLGTGSIFDKLAARNFPWEVTQDEWMRQQNTGFISSDAYEDEYPMKEPQDLSKYPILLDTKNFAGKIIQFRQTGEPLRYVATDDEDEIIRNEQGMATYLTDEQMKEQDLQPRDTTISFFDNNLIIGHIGDSFGATELFVDKDYQHMGIGTYALKLYLTLYPTHHHKPRHLGQMTNAGENTARKVHRLLVEDALRNNKPVPSEILQEYGLDMLEKPI